jgi:ABC-type antimicrobial peptide transport system permease subunit
MLILGIVGGAIGCVAGDFAAVRWGPPGAAVFAAGGWQTYGFALAVALAVTLIPSLAGVLIASRIDPADTLRDL